MRTTLTLDDDVAGLLEQERQSKGLSFKEVVNITLRKGLSGPNQDTLQKRVVTRPKNLGLRPGIDPDRMNQLCDELEVEEYLRKSNRP